jgi:hypothetical protein
MTPTPRHPCPIFTLDTVSHHALSSMPERVVIVMADETKDAKTMLGDLIKKRDELNIAIRVLSETIGVTEAAAIEIGTPTKQVDRGGDFDPLSVVYPGMFYGKSQTQAARLLLEQVRPRPIPTKVIAACFKKGGLEIGGKKPLVNLWGSLDRDEDFLLIPKAGWTLAEWHPASVVVQSRKNRGKKSAEEEVESGNA